jgi:hypothetical protein
VQYDRFFSGEQEMIWNESLGGKPIPYQPLVCRPITLESFTRWVSALVSKKAVAGEACMHFVRIDRLTERRFGFLRAREQGRRSDVSI